MRVVYADEGTTEWSDPFSLDAAGSKGIFSTKSTTDDYQVGVAVIYESFSV